MRQVFWDRAWCLLTSIDVDVFVVDYHPGEAGRVGQVNYCAFDIDDDREAVWGSVSEFLQDVLAVISSPELKVIDGDYGIFRTPDDYMGSSVWHEAREQGRARRDGLPLPYDLVAEIKSE